MSTATMTTTSAMALLVALFVVTVIGIGLLALCVALAQAAARTAQAEHDLCARSGLQGAPVTMDGGLESLGEEDGEGDYVYDIERNTHTRKERYS